MFTNQRMGSPRFAIGSRSLARRRWLSGQALRLGRGQSARFRPRRWAVSFCLVFVLLPVWSGADEYLDEAREYLRDGRINAGVIQLKNALIENPNLAEARFLLAVSYLQLGNLLGAEKELRRARELDWKIDQVLLPLAKSILYQGRFDELLEEFQPATSYSDSLQADLLALRAVAQMSTDRLDDAETSLRESLRIVEDGREGLLASVRLALVRNELDKAEDYVNRVVEVSPKRADGWVTKGHVHRVAKDFPAAITAYSQALELQTQNVDALLGRAASELASQQPDSAIADISAVLELRQNHPRAHYLMAQAQVAKNELNAASASLSRVLLNQPDHGPSHLLLGQIAYSQGNLEQAEDRLDRFHQLMPGNIGAAKLLAAVKGRLKKPAKVVELLKPLAQSPEVANDPQFFALLGSSLLKSGDPDGGAEYLNKAAALAPDATAIRTQLALSHLAGGQTDQAINELESAVELGPDVIHADLILAMTYLKSQQTNKALETARRLIERRPDDPTGANLLGLVYLAQNKIPDARLAFEQQLEIDPNSMSAKLNIARLDANEKNYEAAIEGYQSVLDADARNLSALAGLAAVAASQDKPQDQRRWLERAWSSNPTSIETGAKLVDFYLRRGERLRALNIAREVRTRGPEHPTALNSLAVALLANEEIASAIETLGVLTRTSPNSARAWFLLANAQHLAERDRGARDSLNRVLTLEPNHPQGLKLSAQLALKADDIRRASDDLTRLIELEPENVSVLKLLASLYDQQNESRKAISVLERAHELEPDSMTTRRLAALQWESGRQDVAVALLKEWTQQNPDDEKTRLQLASFLTSSEKMQTAQVEYEKILASDPDNVVALNNLAWILSEQGEARALELAERAAELAPHRAEVADTLGWILAKNDQLNRSRTILQQAVLQAPDIPDIRYHLAIVYDRLGQTADAIEQLNSALDAPVDFAGAEDARALLKRLQGNATSTD